MVQRSQIQFGANAGSEDENLLDELSAEMDRVLERRYIFNQAVSLDDIKESNNEVKRILGNIHKARVRK